MLTLTVEKNGTVEVFRYAEGEDEDAERDRRDFLLAGWSVDLRTLPEDDEVGSW